ncbi:hypothetical protein BJQ90_02044 [Arthrobacter sp. SO3]|nr:hypothetical protein [Arthrobacter sp. SO3]
MAKGKDRRPATSAAAANTKFTISPPTDFDKEHPKFCFRHVQDGYDPKNLPSDKQIDLILQLQTLSSLSWQQIKLAPRQGLGTEFIPEGQIRAPRPVAFEEEAKFMFFRYSGKLPMGGVRVRDVFHVLWIAKDFSELYDHS